MPARVVPALAGGRLARAAAAAALSDDALLAACREAGPPGSPSHRRACRLYRRSLMEWRDRDGAWRRERAERMLLDAEQDVAETARVTAVLRRGLAG